MRSFFLKTKTVKLKTYDDGCVGCDLKDLLEGTTVRPSTVKYYMIEAIEGSAIRVTLYNKAKKIIKVKPKIPRRDKC